MPPSTPAVPSKPAAAEGPKPKMVRLVRSNRGKVSIPLVTEINGKRGTGGMIHLEAGRNLVDADKWAQAAKNSHVKVMLASRVPFMAAQEQPRHLIGRFILEVSEPVLASAPLGHLSETQAVEIVEETNDVKTLGQLLAAESRSPVRRAIEARTKKLSDPEYAKNAEQADAEAQQIAFHKGSGTEGASIGE